MPWKSTRKIWGPGRKNAWQEGIGRSTARSQGRRLCRTCATWTGLLICMPTHIRLPRAWVRSPNGGIITKWEVTEGRLPLHHVPGVEVDMTRRSLALDYFFQHHIPRCWPTRSGPQCTEWRRPQDMTGSEEAYGSSATL